MNIRHVDDESLAHSLDIMILQDTEYFETCTDRWHRARGGGFVLGSISLSQVHRNIRMTYIDNDTDLLLTRRS